MIDLHSHLLPGIDDGSETLEQTLAMARIAVADGIEVMACTPHFTPGVYDNQSQDIRQRVDELNHILAAENINLALVTGCDAHMRPDFLTALRAGEILTLHESRYVLFEPPHSIMPKRMEDLLHNIQVSGFVPIFTHPERYRWLEQHYDIVKVLAENGVWMQITAGSLTGRFGRSAKYWAERMLGEGLVAILATDAHNTQSRPPILSEAANAAARLVGEEEALNLVVTRPACVLEDRPLADVPPLPAPQKPARRKESFWNQLFRR